MDRPSLAVVVPTHNRHERLARCLAALADQDLKPDRIVVVDDGSTPPASVDRLGVPVRLLRNPTPLGPAAARNRGWRAADEDYVLFTDNDCRPSKAWVRELSAQVRPNAIVVGRTIPDPQDGPMRTPLDRTLEIESCDGSFPTANIAYPRAALERLGGFDESFLVSYCEDTDLGRRAVASGLTGCYAEAALVYHAVHRQSLRGAVAERRRLGELARLADIHPRLRHDLWDGAFWNSDHRLLVLGTAGAAVAGLGLRTAAGSGCPPIVRAGSAGLSAAALLPGARYAYWCRRRGLALAGDGWVTNALTFFVLDAVEIAMLAAGTVRYRSLLL